MASLYHACWLIAVQIPAGGGAATPAATETAEKAEGLFGLGFFIPAMLVVLVLYVMLMMRPQQKEQARNKEKLDGLKKNDRVVTAGGIVGTVVNTQPDAEYLTIRIDETNNTKMQILKQSVVRVLKEDDD